MIIIMMQVQVQYLAGWRQQPTSSPLSHLGVEVEHTGGGLDPSVRVDIAPLEVVASLEVLDGDVLDGEEGVVAGDSLLFPPL